MRYYIDYYCVSHIGKVRSVNQDNFFCKDTIMNSENYSEGDILCGTIDSESISVFAIFDGMGGEECGEVASLIAAETISKYSFSKDIPNNLKEYCKIANGKICKYTEEHSLVSMGTTAAILLFGKNRLHLCNIGDSKIFQVSKSGMKQVSFDHIYNASSFKKPPLTQNLGIKEEELIISPYINQLKCFKDDKYLICSDGLTDMVEDDEILRIIESEREDRVAKTLLDKALQNGGKDNISIIYLCLRKNSIISKIKEHFNKKRSKQR